MENETYCGKSCETCTERERTACPGCQRGPGSAFGDCAIARCCREKNHVNCQTCTSESFCGLRRGRDQEPYHRQQKREQEAQQKQALRDDAPVLVRWISVLFWLFIPQIIAGLMTHENVVAAFPSLLLPGTVLHTICLLTYGYALWRMQEIHEGYRSAAFCMLVMALANALSLLAIPTALQILMGLAVAVVGFVGVYLEFTAHAEVLSPSEPQLAQQWRKLWKWNLWCLAALVIALVLLLLAPVLAALTVLAAAIATIVLEVLKLVYLRRMANHFREFC